MKFNYRTEPYAHQHEAHWSAATTSATTPTLWRWGVGSRRYLLTTWCGSTRRARIDTAVIVAPKGVYRNWETAEIPTHFPEADSARGLCMESESQQVTGRTTCKAGVQERGVLRILLANVEGFATKKLPAYVDRFTQGRHSSYLLLMSPLQSRTPRPSALRTLVILGAKAAYKRILTGSPVTKSPLDLYAQCGFMDKRLLGFDSYLLVSRDGTRSRARSGWGRTQFQSGGGLPESGRAIEQAADVLVSRDERTRRWTYRRRVYTTRRGDR